MTRDEALRTGLPLSIGAASGLADERERPDSITTGAADNQVQETEPPARALLPEELPVQEEVVEPPYAIVMPGVHPGAAETLAFDNMPATPAAGVLEHLDRLIAKALAKKYGSADTLHAKLGLLESLL